MRASYRRRLLQTAPQQTVCVLLLFVTAVPNTKLCARGEEDSGGHVYEIRRAGVYYRRLFLQYLLQRCSRVCGGETMEDVCSASTSGLSRPVLPRRLWRVVGWVGFLSERDRWGGERVVGGVLPRINIGTNV